MLKTPKQLKLFKTLIKPFLKKKKKKKKEKKKEVYKVDQKKKNFTCYFILSLGKGIYTSFFTSEKEM